jgi:hypothetical protein
LWLAEDGMKMQVSTAFFMAHFLYSPFYWLLQQHTVLIEDTTS